MPLRQWLMVLGWTGLKPLPPTERALLIGGAFVRSGILIAISNSLDDGRGNTQLSAALTDAL